MSANLPQLTAAAVLVLGVALPSASALAGEAEAKAAIARADAKLELIAQQGAAAQGSSAFISAKEKLTASREELKKDNDQRAEWLAQEAGLMADVAAESVKLETLKREKRELARSVEILRAELGR